MNVAEVRAVAGVQFRVLPVMGVEVAFATNDARVREAIEATYGAWEALAGTSLASPSPAVVRIAVREEEAGASSVSVPFTYDIPDPRRLVVRAPGAEGVADAARAESLATVSASVVARADFADEFLEPLTLFLLGALDRQPIHAASVVRDGVAILLAGRSGAGKSTLAYAARHRGWDVLSDEATYVQMRPHLRVWARRSRVHLRPEARGHFVELGGASLTRLPGGKERVVIASPPGRPRHSERVGICLLERGGDAGPALLPLTPEEVAEELAADLEPGFDLYADTIRSRGRAVAARGAWRLQAGGGPPDDVAARLDEVFAALRAP